MNVTVQGDIDVCMTENFTQAFNIKANLNTAGGECMTHRMIICILDSTRMDIFLKSVLQCPRLDKCVWASGQTNASEPLTN